MKTIKNLFALLLLSSAVSASNIDSLETLLTSAKDTAKISLLNEIATELTNTGANNLALIKSEEALLIATQFNEIGLIIKSHNMCGIINVNDDKYEDALMHYNKSLVLSVKSEDKEEEANAYYLIGETYYFMERYSEAIEDLNSSIKIYELLKEDKKSLDAVGIIAGCYYSKGDYENSLKSYLYALNIQEKLGLKNLYPDSYLGIGNIYLAKGDYDNSIKQYEIGLDWAKKSNLKSAQAQILNNLGHCYTVKGRYGEAMDACTKSLRLKEEVGADKYDIINTLVNIANIYMTIQNYDKALESYNKTLALSTEIKSKGGMALSNINIGIVYGKQQKYQQAIEALLKAVPVCREVKRMDLLKSAYQELAGDYSHIGNFNEAYKSQLRYSEIKDTLINESNTRSLNEMQTKYDTQKKEDEIEILSSQKEKQRTIIISVIIGMILFVIVSFFLFAGYKKIKKAKDIISSQKIVVEQKNQEITSSIVYAKRIQSAILPNMESVKESFPNSFVMYQPKDIVSGDFYWMNDLGEEVLMACADCTGHGVSGSLMSMIGFNLLNQISNNTTEPALILSELDRQIRKNLHQADDKYEKTNDGMDIALIKYNKKTREVRYAGANRPLVVVSGGVLNEIKPDKKAMGGDTGSERNTFTNHQLFLNEGDTLYMYSDGYADQFGGEEGRKKMTTKKLKALLQEIAGKQIDAQKTALVSYFENWKGENEQIDDVCVIGIKA